MSEVISGWTVTAPRARARATFVSFPSKAGRSNVTLAVFAGLPPSQGTVRSFDGHVVSVHLGRALPVRRRREDLVHEGTVSRGDLTVIPAGWQSACWTSQPVDFLHVELDPAFVREATSERSENGTRDPEVPCLFSLDDPLCRELALSMWSEAQALGIAARMYVESAAGVIAQRLLRLGRRRSIPRPRAGLRASVFERAKEFLHDEMSRNPGVAELAAAVGMSVDHFSRMFKRSTGVSPHQYLCNLRLERAKLLLADDRAPIIEIAYEVGFSNPSQFSAFFRKRTGLSPSAYRRAAQPGG